MIKTYRRFSLSTAFVMLFTVFTMWQAPGASAVNCDYEFYQRNDFGVWYDPCADVCSADGTGAGAVLSSNTDYKGSEILTDAQLAAIEENRLVYEKAETETGVPWQAIAVLHLRETSLKRINPANEQGIYQDFAKVNGPYPPSNGEEVSEEEFLRQTIWAANFFKNKATTPSLVESGDENEIKDAFFGYNGRAQAYIDQADRLGYPNDWDGSPYVMNGADAVRDPTVNTESLASGNTKAWGQIKSDGGSLEYPANRGYGAFVIYASLAGIGTTDCGSTLSGTLNERIVQLAYQEQELWKSGKMGVVTNTGALNPERDFTKYTYGIRGDWCAWFISWILKEAGKPVDDTDTPDWSMVSQFKNQSDTLGFTFHEKSSGYKPKPGDFAIYRGSGHINVVVGYDDRGRMQTIGGNEGSSGNVNGGFYASQVKLNVGYGESATSYIEVNG